jgi:hypothetical protein
VVPGALRLNRGHAAVTACANPHAPKWRPRAAVVLHSWMRQLTLYIILFFFLKKKKTSLYITDHKVNVSPIHHPYQRLYALRI